MKIQMKDGFEITEEIEQIAKGYDLFSCYIDNYTQMKQAEERNTAIMNKLMELGVHLIKE
jgi:putative N-acetylmannosamine-6-phosphate epimerase